jgi:molecular chaperone DnaK (HSP70)
MIGINIGSLNTTISQGQFNGNSNRLHCELILSETSKRTCPSLITYGENNRLIGDQANLNLRKNINSSFENLSRYIGIHSQSAFAQKELRDFHLIGPNLDINTNKFNFIYKGQNLSLSPEQILTGYLNLIKYIYLINNKISVETLVFSTPDYFTCYQKNSYFNIIKACDFSKDVHMINDSTAITLYFGYKKYKEYFIVQNPENNNLILSVNPTIIKNIIFIDIGHSKTTFILSKLTYDVFHVLDSVSIPFLGGRDFDEEIFKFCSIKFKEKTNFDILNNKKCKLKLLNVISKARKNLTVNQDAHIIVDSLYNDEDFNYLLTRNEFENIISKQINLFKNIFQNFYLKNLENFKGLEITNIEMAGELMRTPILERTVKEIIGIEMSKTILTDECIAIGCSLYASLMKGRFPIQGFKGIYHLNIYAIYYQIENEEKKCLISSQYAIPFFHTIYFDNKYFNNNFKIGFYHNKNEIEKYVPCKEGLLVEYEINPKIILEQNGGIKEIYITFMVDNNGNVHLNKLFTKQNNNEIPIQFKNGMVIASRRELYTNIQINNNLINELKNVENKFMKDDEEFKNFSNKRNLLEGRYYEIKNKINEKNLGVQVINGKTINDILNEIENILTEYQNKFGDLNIIQQKFDEIINKITSPETMIYKMKSLEQIKFYENKISEEYSKFLGGQFTEFSQNKINDCVNMIEHFKTKFELAGDINEINSLNNEFQKEIKKYF